MTDRSFVEFDISGTKDDYIDFVNTILFVKVKVVRLNGNNIATNTAVGSVNLFLHSLF